MSLIEHLEKLRHFYKLTSYRSINEGAQGMGMSQAGLSKSISSLESVLETSLFIRSQDGLVLTREGDLLLAATKKILSEAANFESGLRSLKARDVPRKFRIGMYDSIAVYLFPDLVSYINVIYPSLQLELVVDRSSVLSTLVNQAKIDLAVGVNFNDQKFHKATYFPLFEDHYSFFVSPRNTGNLNRLPIIYHPDASGEGGASTHEYLKSLVKGRVCHQVFNFETIKTLTAEGLGIGILPTQVARPMVAKNQLVSARIPKAANMFGKHSIGFLADNNFQAAHKDFVQDIYRLGERWAKA